MLLKLQKLTEKFSPEFRKIIGNVSWLFAERILTMLVALSVGIYVIRYLGADNFGQLSYSTSFVAIFSMFAQLGLNQIIIRNIVQEEKATPEILGTAFSLKLVASVITIGLIGISSWLFNSRTDIQFMIFVLSLGLLLSAFDVIEYWFESQVLSKILAMLRSIQLILSSLIKLVFIALHLPLIYFVWLLLADQIIKVPGLLWIYLKQRQSIFGWRVNWSRAIVMVKDSWPLILSSIMIMLYMKIDQVMLGNMADAQAVGNYAAAIRFSEVWYFIPIAICSSVFPAILRTKQRSEERYNFKLQQLYDLMAWLALAIAIPMTFISKPLMVTLIGHDFSEAGNILSVHIWSGVFVFLGHAQHQWLMAENINKFSFAKTSLGAISNILLNLLLIPSYQGVGAAIATMISYGIYSHFSCLLYRPLWANGWMLTKALFIPFNFRKNLFYLNQLRKLRWNS